MLEVGEEEGGRWKYLLHLRLELHGHGALPQRPLHLLRAALGQRLALIHLPLPLLILLIFVLDIVTVEIPHLKRRRR